MQELKEKDDIITKFKDRQTSLIKEKANLINQNDKLEKSLQKLTQEYQDL